MSFADLILETQKLTLLQQIQLIITLLQSIVKRIFSRTEITPASSSQSILDRMGGLPQYFLEHGQLSDRDNRRAAIQSYLSQKQCRLS
jgi:hypothetical protein